MTETLIDIPDKIVIVTKLARLCELETHRQQLEKAGYKYKIIQIPKKSHPTRCFIIRAIVQGDPEEIIVPSARMERK